MIGVTKFIKSKLTMFDNVFIGQPNWEVMDMGVPLVVIQFDNPTIQTSIGGCSDINTNTLSIKYVGVNQRDVEVEQADAESIIEVLKGIETPQTFGNSRVMFIEAPTFLELGTDDKGKFIWEVRAVVTWSSLVSI